MLCHLYQSQVSKESLPEGFKASADSPAEISDDDDAEWFRKEVGENPDKDMFRDAFISQRSAHFRFTVKDRLTSRTTIIYDILLCHFAVT